MKRISRIFVYFSVIVFALSVVSYRKDTIRVKTETNYNLDSTQVKNRIMLGKPKVLGYEAVVNSCLEYMDKYCANYSIEYILGNYSYFVKENLTGGYSAHTIGPVIVGGDLELNNSFGLVKMAPSYAGRITQLFDYSDISWAVGTQDNAGKLYYGEFCVANADWLKNKLNMAGSDYFDKEAAFTSICEQSDAMATGGLGKDEGYNLSKGVITIDFEKCSSVTISESDYHCASKIVLSGIKNDDILKYPFIISISGHGNFELDTSKVYIGDMAIPSCFLMNLTMYDSLAYAGGQYYAGGMNLVWNFPKADSVIIKSLSGSVIVPRGDVIIMSGNHEGQIIAENVNTNSESHFYPYKPMCDDRPKEDIPTEATTEQTTTEITTTEVTTEQTTTEITTTEATTEQTTTEITTTEVTTEQQITTESTTESTTEEEIINLKLINPENNTTETLVLEQKNADIINEDLCAQKATIDEAVNTGDDSRLIDSIICLLISLVGYISLLYIKNKSNKS